MSFSPIRKCSAMPVPDHSSRANWSEKQQYLSRNHLFFPEKNTIRFVWITRRNRHLADFHKTSGDSSIFYEWLAPGCWPIWRAKLKWYHLEIDPCLAFIVGVASVYIRTTFTHSLYLLAKWYGLANLNRNGKSFRFYTRCGRQMLIVYKFV